MHAEMIVHRDISMKRFAFIKRKRGIRVVARLVLCDFEYAKKITPADEVASTKSAQKKQDPFANRTRKDDLLAILDVAVQLMQGNIPRANYDINQLVDFDDLHKRVCA